MGERSRIARAQRTDSATTKGWSFASATGRARPGRRARRPRRRSQGASLAHQHELGRRENRPNGGHSSHESPQREFRPASVSGLGSCADADHGHCSCGKSSVSSFQTRSGCARPRPEKRPPHEQVHDVLRMASKAKEPKVPARQPRERRRARRSLSEGRRQPRRTPRVPEDEEVLLASSSQQRGSPGSPSRARPGARLAPSRTAERGNELSLLLGAWRGPIQIAISGWTPCPTRSHGRFRRFEIAPRIDEPTRCHEPHPGSSIWDARHGWRPPSKGGIQPEDATSPAPAPGRLPARAESKAIGVVVLAPQAGRLLIPASGARTPGTRLATIASPLPEPPRTMQRWHSPLRTTASAAARPAFLSGKLSVVRPEGDAHGRRFWHGAITLGAGAMVHRAFGFEAKCLERTRRLARRFPRGPTGLHHPLRRRAFERKAERHALESPRLPSDRAIRGAPLGCAFEQNAAGQSRSHPVSGRRYLRPLRRSAASQVARATAWSSTRIECGSCVEDINGTSDVPERFFIGLANVLAITRGCNPLGANASTTGQPSAPAPRGTPPRAPDRFIPQLAAHCSVLQFNDARPARRRGKALAV